MGNLIDFELVRRLRKAFELYDGYSAQQVLEVTKGTLLRAFIELALALHRTGIEFERASTQHPNEVTELYPVRARIKRLLHNVISRYRK